MNSFCGGVVAVDVGNSAIKLAVRRNDVTLDHAIGLSHGGWASDAIRWASDQFSCDELRWIIASVRRSAADQLIDAIGQTKANVHVDLITREHVPMAVGVDHPDQLGIDRLIGAYAAHQQFGAPLAVVDAGSAITVDWVNDAGCFDGGAILPGLELQSRALASGTEALPEIEWNVGNDLLLPAKNTIDAIRGGILAGAAATVDALILRYQRNAGVPVGQCPVVITGGDGPAISSHLVHNHQVIPNLVCRGLLELPRSGQRHRTTS